jgi:hypothetical protein
MTQLPENIVPMTGKFVPAPLRILAASTEGTIEQIGAGSGCERLKTGVFIGRDVGAGADFVGVGAVVLVAVGVDVACLMLTVAVGMGVAVGSTVVRLQARGNKNARPRMNLCQNGCRDIGMIAPDALD